MSVSIDSLARIVFDAQRTARTIAPISADRADFDLAAGYAVGARLRALREAQGAVFAGRKIGFTNAGMWKAFGVDAPIWGPMYADTIIAVPQRGTRLSLAGFCEPRIEPELVFHFHRSPPAGADVDTLLACVDWVAPGLEVVQSHFPGWQFRAADAVADGALHAALLLGSPLMLDGQGEGLRDRLGAVAVDLLRDDELVETGDARQVLGHPLLALQHLMQVLDDQGAQPLAAGEIITTGTMTMAYHVASGQCWQTVLRGLPLVGMAVEFTD